MEDCFIQDRPAWGAFIKHKTARNVLLDPAAGFFNTEGNGFSRDNIKEMCLQANKIKFTEKYMNHLAPLQQDHNHNLAFCLQYAYAYNIIAPELKVCFPHCFPFAPA